MKQTKLSKTTVRTRIWVAFVFLTTMTVTAVSMYREVGTNSEEGWQCMVLLLSLMASWVTTLALFPLPLLILSLSSSEYDAEISNLLEDEPFGFDIEDRRNKDIFWRVTTFALGVIAARRMRGEGDPAMVTLVFAMVQFVAQWILRTIVLPLYDKMVKGSRKTS